MARKTLPKKLTMCTVAQAAKFLETSRQAVWAAVKNGRLDSAKYGGVTLVTRASVLKYEETRRPGGPAKTKRKPRR
jgi:excisionase family DNA binding protein